MENENYKAVVVKISNLRKHSNADRLLCTNIFGNNIIVGLDTKEGDIGIYFPLESQIGEGFAKANDLIRRKDDSGKTVGGMFDNNRRVRAQTLRAERSMGFWIPVVSLDYLGLFKGELKEGFEFSELCGQTICQKYIPIMNKARNSGTGPKSKKPKVSKIVNNQFKFHFDTLQLGKNIHKINPEDLISISYKLHGTSAITGRVLCNQKMNLLQRTIFKLLSFILYIENTEYEYIHSSRSVIKNDDINKKQNHYYKYDLWSEVGKIFEGRLHKGETIYYEIVGYTNTGSYVQGGYDYSCKEKENRIFVYRITMTNTDGIVTELQWNQLAERCREIGVDIVPQIYYGPASKMFPINTEVHWNQNFLECLSKEFLEKDSIFCVNVVPEEGIVVRKEGLVIESFKLKAFRFFEYESKELDKGEIDMETMESNSEVL